MKRWMCFRGTLDLGEHFSHSRNLPIVNGRVCQNCICSYFWWNIFPVKLLLKPCMRKHGKWIFLQVHDYPSTIYWGHWLYPNYFTDISINMFKSHLINRHHQPTSKLNVNQRPPSPSSYPTIMLSCHHLQRRLLFLTSDALSDVKYTAYTVNCTPYLDCGWAKWLSNSESWLSWQVGQPSPPMWELHSLGAPHRGCSQGAILPS